MIKTNAKFTLASLTLALSVAATGAVADEAVPALISSRMLTAIDTTPPDYPRYADAMGIDGYAVLEFTVLESGEVSAPAVRSTSSTVFSKAAIAAVEEWKFEPVYQDGIAVPVRTGVKISFVPRTE